VVLEWHWLETQFGMASGAAYSKLLDAQQPVHDLVAREVTQNSWDAALRHRSEHPEVRDPKFKLTYEFREITGATKKTVAKALDLNELRGVLRDRGHETLRLQPGETVLDQVDSADPLRVLYVTDSGATGLRGDPVGAELSASDFYRAFGQIGGNDRDTGGGSFGFGKSAFIKASRIRCVVAYSSFMSGNDDTVTRRLWGFIYWPGFGNLTGVAQLGVLGQNAGPISRPATDKVADEVAERLGFQVRRADNFHDCGTSLLIVDHVLDPAMLKDSLERYWWPAIETYRSSFSLNIKSDTAVLNPQPLTNPKVKPFIRAFEIASDKNAQLRENERKPTWRGIRDEGVGRGELGLVRFEGEPEHLDMGDDHFTHVALIRGPRMVVTYQGFGNSTANTAIRGAYIASDDADPYLRKSEPAAHNQWETSIDESYGPDWKRTAAVVSRIKKSIRDEVRKFQAELRRQPKSARSSLSWANELFASVFSEPVKAGKQTTGKRKPRLLIKKRGTYVSESRARTLLRTDHGALVRESWSVQLPSHVTSAQDVTISMSAWIMTDGGSDLKASDRISTSPSGPLPEGFLANADGSVSGTVHPETEVQFTFQTAEYERDWNVKTDLSVSSAADEDEGAA
jgi:hypothetical protein